VLTSATMRLIAATATTVVANSAYTARALLASAPGANVEVVPNAVDLRRFDPVAIDREAARAALARLLGAEAGRRFMLGVVAQLTPWKGQGTAIEALRLACAAGLDAHLLLIGSAKFVASATRFDNDAYVAGLRRRIADAGLESRVSWLGERGDVPELMRALDVLLLPSQEEPFGRALIEAMALEVPVLATSVGGPPEIVEEGREGFLLAPDEPGAWAAAVLRLAEDPREAAALGRAGRERVLRKYTVAHHVQAMLDVYSGALRGGAVAA
jgi:glycosyltransferase involved in cell wall biosynthesis